MFFLIFCVSIRAQIPKGDGNMRSLGIPTVAGRVAHTVIKWRLEKHIIFFVKGP